jgi:D-alanyl-D-alanine carboxypeptidase-like protein
MTDRVSSLYASLQVFAARYLGKQFIMTSGDRTCAQQRRVSTERTSYHLCGRAFDAVVFPYSLQDQTAIGRYAEQLGFRWGGNFKTGDYQHDVVHFDDGRRFPLGGR